MVGFCRDTEGALVNEHPAPDWDPRSPAVLSDQRDAYDAMREECPVAYSDFLGWSLFRHQDIANVLADPKTFSNASKHLAIPNGMDPPEHAIYRAALEPYFTPERMHAFESECRRIASELIDGLPVDSEFHFIREFAHPFTLKTQCAFLGWPIEVWEHLHGWTHGNQEASLSRDRAAAAALAREFTGYVAEQLEVRREAGATSSQDVTSSLMTTEVDGARLTDEQIVSVLRNWVAGQGTVSAGIEIVMLHLVQNPDLQEQLRQQPTLIPAAIEEILRLDGPLVANRRLTTREVRFGERTIGAGEHLTLMWIAADRDPHVFDEPGKVRLDRDQRENYLFGAGIHVCLGASLARLEMRVALEEWLDRATMIKLGKANPPKRAVYPSNGLEYLPILFR